MPGRMESVENLSRQQYRVRGAVDGFPPFPPLLGNRYAIPTVPQPRRRRYLSYEQETQGDTSIELPRGTFLLGAKGDILIGLQHYASDKASAMEVLDTFFRSVGMRSLAGLRDWTGGNDRVWTTSNSSLSALLLNCQSDEARGSTVNDALGLGKTVGEGPEGKPLMISVYYPREFTAVNQDFHFGPGTATVYTRSAPNSTSFHAEPCTSPLLVVARAGSTAHSR